MINELSPLNYLDVKLENHSKNKIKQDSMKNNDSKLFEIRRSKKFHKNHKAGHINLQLSIDKRSNKT